MFLIPSKKVLLKSPLTQEDILSRLKLATTEGRPKYWQRFNNTDTKKFYGKVQDSSFDVYVIPRGRNSFVPHIVGSLESRGGQSLIKIKMSLDPLVLAFMWVWLGIVLMACIIFIPFLSKSSGLTFGDFIPLIMLAGGILMLFVPFKILSQKAIKELKTLLKATEVSL